MPHAGFSIHVADSRGEDTIIVAAAVINCRGSETLPTARIPLLRSILRPEIGIASVNRPESGITVNADFEASPGVYVIGPLLSGYTTELDAIWNLESTPRIHALSERTAGTVASEFRRLKQPAYARRAFCKNLP